MPSISGHAQGTVNHTYYDILEIFPDSTNQQIKDAYKRLAILKHPDKNLGDTAGACAAFQQLQTAYDTLSKPSLRAKYDASMIPSTTKAAKPRNRRSSPQAPRRRRPATPPPERPSPPAPPTAPKPRCPRTPPPARHANDRPWWMSPGWYEKSIDESVWKEKMYRDEIAFFAALGHWSAWIDRLNELVQNERSYQATLRRELEAINAKLREFRY